MKLLVYEILLVFRKMTPQYTVNITLAMHRNPEQLFIHCKVYFYSCTFQGFMRYVTEDVCTGDHEHIKEARYRIRSLFEPNCVHARWALMRRLPSVRL